MGSGEVALRYLDGRVVRDRYTAIGLCIVRYDDNVRHEFVRTHVLDSGIYIFEEVEVGE